MSYTNGGEVFMLTKTRTDKEYFHEEKKSSLSAIDLFRKIPSTALWQIENQVLEKKYAKRECMFLEDDRADYVWFVKEGHVKLANHLMDGRSQTIVIKGPMGMFGLSSMGQEVYGVYSMAETDATVISIPVQAFQDLLNKYSALRMAFLFHLSKLLRQAKAIEALSGESAEKRLLHSLVILADEYGNTIPLTSKEFAELAGTAEETCIRLFSRFKKAGLIASTHRKITIKNMEQFNSRLESL